MTQTDRRDGLTGDVAYKRPVRVATTTNITLSGTQTIDGVAVVADDRVLVKDQSTTTENGIYVCASSAWERAKDFDGAYDFVNGTAVYVRAGSVSATKVFRCTLSAEPPVIGTSTITWAADGTPSVTSNTGAWVLIEAQAASTSSTIDFDASLDSTYDAYMIVVTSARPATDGTTLQLRTGTGGGPTYDTSTYQYRFDGGTADGSAANSESESTSAAAIILGLATGNAAHEGVNATIWFNDPDSSAVLTQFGFKAFGVNASTQAWSAEGNGAHGTSAETITGIRLMMTSGNITSGEFVLYGLKKS
jgi:uncharacterized cupin superfamily protein